MPDDPRPLTADALTIDLLADRLRVVAAELPAPAQVQQVEALLTRYVRAHQRAGRVRVARALGLPVADCDGDTDLLALHLLEAVQALPEFNTAAKAPGSPASAPAAPAGGDAPPAPPAAPAGAAAGLPDGDCDDAPVIALLPVSPALRARLDDGARVHLFGGVPVPKMLGWMRDALRGDVVWIASDAMPSRPAFNAGRDAGIVLLQGLMGHDTMSVLTGAAKAAGVPFARANMPGRGSLRRAVEIIDQSYRGAQA